jgi:RNA polymerase sigma factor (sigma-70 family)
MTSLALDSAATATTVERAVAGDQLAFARIVAAYHLDLVRVAFVICGDERLAEDAAQSAWWIAWAKLASLRDPDRLKSWLVAVAANEARKIVRRENRRGIMELRVTPDPAPRADPASAIDHVDLANALGHLKPEDRALVALRYAADLDSSELGPALGMTPSGVRTRLSRLLDRLRKELYMHVGATASPAMTYPFEGIIYEGTIPIPTFPGT